MLIRTAKPEDVLDLLPLAYDYYENNDHMWHGMKVDYAHTAMHMDYATRDPNQVLIIAVNEKGIQGGMWLKCGAPAWSPQIMVNDLFLYVKEEYRTFSLARRLVIAMETWAKTKNASKIFVGANSGIDGNKATKAIYKRFGYVEIGTNFTKEI